MERAPQHERVQKQRLVVTVSVVAITAQGMKTH